MSLKAFATYLLLPFHRPIQAIKSLTKDSHKLSYAALAILLQGGLYTCTVFIGHRNGFGAVTTPFLNIPAEDYYYWETFFTIPVFFLTVLVFAGTARLLAAAWGGRGSFENAFALYGLALVGPTLVTMWLPETILMVFFPDYRLEPLGGFSVFPAWVDAVRQLAGGIWPVIITGLGITHSEKLSRWKSALVTFLAAVPSVTLTLIFVR